MKKTRFSISLFCIIALSSVSGCTRSGKRTGAPENEQGGLKHERTPVPNQKRTVVKMKNVNGVYEIPSELNGVEMYFVFDTGASMISISEKQINRLRELGKFSDEEDITGDGVFMDANGDISEGTIVLIRKVRIGDRTLTDVEASVVHNLKAPLLMGQSALAQFGKISIDYKTDEITFE